MKKNAVVKAKVKGKATIAEIEALLRQEEERPIQILTNGEIKAGTRRSVGRQRPLTMRENLGGEYAYA